MHSLMIPSYFALLLLPLLLFADAHSENLIGQAILPVDQPFDDNNNNPVDRTIETEIIAKKYAYLMKLSVKTSGDDKYIKTYATLDTGSDLIWLNANDCVGDACHCSSSKTKTTTTTDQPNCIEKPKQFITCDDRMYCDALKRLKNKTCSASGPCKYDGAYQDGASTHGMLGTGNFSFPRIIDDDKPFVENITFGVSTFSEAKGHFENQSVGVVGLGFGTLSLIKQLGKMGRKFSYCLPNPESSSPNPKSKIKFGNKVETRVKFSTRLLTKQEADPVCELNRRDCVCEDRYCVRLASISLNDRDENKITVSEKTNNKVMVIDSGTTFTYLVNGLFEEFFNKVKLVIGHEPQEFKPYAHCFNESADSAEKLKNVSFEFGGVGGSGTAKIELKRENFFDRHTPDKGKTNYLCLTVVDGDKKENNHARLYEDIGRENGNSKPHLLGNRAQMDFLVAFDLSKNEEESKKKVKVVSFAKNCGEEKKLE